MELFKTAVIIIVGVIVYGAVCFAFFSMGRRFQRDLATVRGENPGPELNHADSSPRVIVNVPADYKPLESLPEETRIEGERARLWWTVYQKTIETDYEDSNDAIEAANEAVDKVFGPATDL